MFFSLFLTCSPLIDSVTMNSLVATESNYNQYAIAQIKGISLLPVKSKDEYTNLVKRLSASNKLAFIVNDKNYYDEIDIDKIDFTKDRMRIYVSWGNNSYLPKTQHEAETIIDELELKKANYSVGLGQINKANFNYYNTNGKELFNACKNLEISQDVLLKCYNNSPNKKVSEALSCYYSGNYNYGFIKENNNTAYVERIINNVDKKPIVASIKNEIDYVNKRISSANNKTLTKMEVRPKNYNFNIRSVSIDMKTK